MLNKKLLLILLCALLSLALFGCGNAQDTPENSDPQTPSVITKISLDDLAANLNSYLLVDLRQDEAYLGYLEENMPRGGHLPQAVQFSAGWLDYLDNSQAALAGLLEEKGLTKDKNILLYHIDNQLSNNFAAQLQELGYENILVFEDLAAWISDNSLPLEAAPNYQIFVDANWVNQLISGQSPQTYENEKYLILEASWGPVSEAYEAGHIPGAIHFDTDNFETEENLWNIGPLDRVESNLKAFGITSDTTVVVYSDDPSAAGRVTLALMWAGVKDVRYLNGGWIAWEKSGFEVETTPNQPAEGADFDLEVPQHPEYLIQMPAQVLEEQKDPNFRLVSIRSWEEFTGQTSGYSYIEGAGEPAGAVWGHGGSDPYHMEDYLDVDNTLRNFAEIQALWDEWDIQAGNKVSFYCGTGWRATLPWLMTYSQGWQNISMFDGGWYTWEMDDTLPVQTGDPRNK